MSNQNQTIANLKYIITLLESSNLRFNEEEVLKLNNKSNLIKKFIDKKIKQNNIERKNITE
jgi:hypothetical protein